MFTSIVSNSYPSQACPAHSYPFSDCTSYYIPLHSHPLFHPRSRLFTTGNIPISYLFVYNISCGHLKLLRAACIPNEFFFQRNFLGKPNWMPVVIYSFWCAHSTFRLVKLFRKGSVLVLFMHLPPSPGTFREDIFTVLYVVKELSSLCSRLYVPCLQVEGTMEIIISFNGLLSACRFTFISSMCFEFLAFHYSHQCVYCVCVLPHFAEGFWVLFLNSSKIYY